MRFSALLQVDHLEGMEPMNDMACDIIIGDAWDPPRRASINMGCVIHTCVNDNYGGG